MTQDDLQLKTLQQQQSLPGVARSMMLRGPNSAAPQPTAAPMMRQTTQGASPPTGQPTPAQPGGQSFVQQEVARGQDRLGADRAREQKLSAEIDALVQERNETVAQYPEQLRPKVKAAFDKKIRNLESQVRSLRSNIAQTAAEVGIREQAGSVQPRAENYTLGDSTGMRAGLADQVAATQQRQAPTLQAPEVQQAQAAQVGAAPNIMGAGNDFRGAQQQLLGTLQGAVAGQGPSVAEQQLRLGGDRAMAQALAVARSQPGLSPGAAARLAGQQQMAAQMDVNSQAAQLRAQEQMQARGELAGLASGARGQDIGLATTQAGMDQQGQLANAGFLQDVNLANAAQANQYGMQGALANQAAALEQSRANDAMVQALMNMGFSADQAQLGASMGFSKDQLAAAGIRTGAESDLLGALTSMRNTDVSTNAQLEAARIEAANQPSIWERVAGGLVSGVAGGLTETFLSPQR